MMLYVCWQTSIKLQVTSQSCSQLNFTKGKTKCFPKDFKLLFSRVCFFFVFWSCLITIHNLFWYKFILHIKKKKLRTMQQPEISCTDTKLKSKQKSFRLSEAYDLLPYVYVWWCNGWMFVSSLSLRFPFFSAVFMFAVSSSHHFP